MLVCDEDAVLLHSIRDFAAFGVCCCRKMDEGLAQECVRRLICIVLQRSGFDAASPDALVELEDKLLMRQSAMARRPRSHS
jgi:hypothetical protein